MTMVPGTLYCMPYTAKPQTLYWYFPRLPVAGTTGLNDFVIREVKITEGTPEVNAEGAVTNVTDLICDVVETTVVLGGKQKGETSSSTFKYTVTYEEGEIAQDSNVRVDTVTNDRPGIILKKEDWNGQALAGAVFTLKDNDGNLIGTFTSDENGLITTAFLSADKPYTLAETQVPKPYHGLEKPLTIVWSSGNVAVTGEAETEGYYSIRQASGNTLAMLTVKNRKFTLKAVKKDADTGAPLSGVTFALHKQHTVGGVTQFDTEPMAGYEALVTNEDGVIPLITEALAAGTYQLREKQPRAGYMALPAYIHFTVSDTGMVSLGTVPDGVSLNRAEAEDGTLKYELVIENHQNANVQLKKEDHQGNALTGSKFRLCKYGTTWEVVEGYDEIDMTSVSQVELSKLMSGRYRLTETQAPAGYILLEKEVYFTISFAEGGGAVITLTDETGTGQNSNANVTVDGMTITVKNNPGVELPSTGGHGTVYFYLFGGMMIFLAVTGLIMAGKRNRDEV